MNRRVTATAFTSVWKDAGHSQNFISRELENASLEKKDKICVEVHDIKKDWGLVMGIRQICQIPAN